MLAVCQHGLLRLAVSRPVLVEARRNVTEKMGLEKLRSLHELLAVTPLEIASVPSGAAFDSCVQIVGEKDAHVLAAAVHCGALFLLTLDRPLRDRVNGAKLSLLAATPGDFIRQALPTHPDYPMIR